MEHLNQFLILILPVLFSQFIKILYLVSKTKHFKLHYIWENSNFPSTHTTFVVAITTWLYLTEGLTNLFLVSFVFSSIVIRDSLGVRRLTGLQSQYINKLFKHIFKKNSYLDINEGHTLFQVFAGFILGLTISLSIYYLL